MLCTMAAYREGNQNVLYSFASSFSSVAISHHYRAMQMIQVCQDHIPLYLNWLLQPFLFTLTK